MQIEQPTRQWLHLPGMRTTQRGADNSDTDLPNELRLPLIGFLPNKIRNHIIATIGEFTGTFLFLFCAFAATQVANTAQAGKAKEDESVSNIPNTNTLVYIALAFGFSLAVNAWIFFRISGGEFLQNAAFWIRFFDMIRKGLFNPAVTVALALVGAVGWVRAAIVVIAQILGATSAAAVVAALFPGKLRVTTELGGGTSTVQGLWIEALLTAQLVFTIIMLAAEKHKGTFLAPIGIGLSLFVSELTGVYFTGGSLNPARSFGPCVVLRNFPGYHWIYWLGPLIGAVVAAIFYHLVKVLEYETANPGQDFDDKEMDRFAFDEENAATGADAARPDLASPPLSPATKGYRGRSVSNRTRPASRSAGIGAIWGEISPDQPSQHARNNVSEDGHVDLNHLSPPTRMDYNS